LSILADFQGFKFVENKTLKSCYRLDGSLEIGFEFGALTTGTYDFNLEVLADGNNYVFELTQADIDKYTTIRFNGFVDLNNVPTGNWKAKLVTKNLTTSETVEGFDFNINIINECKNANSGLSINSPLKNSITSMPFPYGSYKANVFWTQSGIFNITSTMWANTKISANKCALDIDLSSSESDIVKTTLIVFNTNRTAGSCTESINTSLWKNVNLADNTTQIDVTTDVSIGTYPTDSLLVGIDNESPTIISVIPSTNAYDENMLIDVNVEDNLSGIDSVEIRMIHTDSDTVYPNYFADFNADTNTFQVTVNTLILPNGKYDINTIVIDVAGNQSNLVVDPIIDHNTPVITGIKVTTNPMIRNNIIIVDVNATDVFDSNSVAGIEHIRMRVTTAEVDIFSTDMNYVSGNLYTAKFDTNLDWNIATYRIFFDIKDKTVNTVHMNTNDIDVNLLPNYYFNVVNQSKEIASGTNTQFIIDGNFRSDLNIVPTDVNKILITSNIVGITSVQFDENGLFRITTNSVGKGTYYIDLNYNTLDYNYTTRVTLSVSNPSRGGGGGSGGGLPRTNVLDVNTPIEETGPTVPEEIVTSTDTNNELEIVNGETNPSPATGAFGLNDNNSNALTGLFGLGNMMGALPFLLIALLVVIGLFIGIRKK